MAKTPIANSDRANWQSSGVDDIVNTNSGVVKGTVSGNVTQAESTLVVLTQAEYDALTPDPDTLYFVTG